VLSSSVNFQYSCCSIETVEPSKFELQTQLPGILALERWVLRKSIANGAMGQDAGGRE
jgi:hypothetical protein